MAPMCWAPPVQGCATRRAPDVLDLRPLSTPQLTAQAQRLRPLGEPVPSRVRSNTAYGHRAKSHGTALQKRHHEEQLEHTRYENGIFLGTWRDPVLDGRLPERGGPV